jgi:hypothetical protein
MSTLVQASILHAKALLNILMYVVVASFCISRACIFYEVYVIETVRKKEDAWLRVQCKNPEFYSNIRQHTDLCQQVEHHAQTWILLTALNAMLTRNQWCGAKQSCAEYIHHLLVQGFAWPMVACFALLMVALPYIIAAKAKQSMQKMWMEKMWLNTTQHNSSSRHLPHSMFALDQHAMDQHAMYQQALLQNTYPTWDIQQYKPTSQHAVCNSSTHWMHKYPLPFAISNDRHYGNKERSNHTSQSRIHETSLLLVGGGPPDSVDTSLMMDH